MKKCCPACHRTVPVPPFNGKSTHVDFACSQCGAALRLDLTRVVVCMFACAIPCIVLVYPHFPGFMPLLGDGLICMAFGMLFWPLRRIVVRNKQ